MIIRAIHNREKPYFQMRRATAQDSKLTARELGVLTYLLSKPDTWEPTIADICKRFADVGEQQAYKIVARFIELRYARRTQERNGGKITKHVTEIYEEPLPENHQVEGAPVGDFQEVENQHLVSPHGENHQHREYRVLENTERREEREKENTEQQQRQTDARPIAAAALYQSEQNSRYGFTEIRQYVEATKAGKTDQQKGGLARTLLRTGEEDDQIQAFFERKEKALTLKVNQLGASRSIPRAVADPEWQAALDAISQQISADEFSTWFRPLVCVGRSSGALELWAPDPVFEDWILNNYREIVRRALGETGIEFVFDAAEEAA
jgi:hypothetical protein